MTDKRPSDREDILAKIDAEVAAMESDPALAAAMASCLEFRTRLDDLVATFPTEEQDAARRGLYLDADGNPRTRHRALRSC